MRPHRRRPTRLPRPWDSPGKNTGVGCHPAQTTLPMTDISAARPPSQLSHRLPLHNQPLHMITSSDARRSRKRFAASDATTPNNGLFQLAAVAACCLLHWLNDHWWEHRGTLLFRVHYLNALPVSLAKRFFLMRLFTGLPSVSRYVGSLCPSARFCHLETACPLFNQA